MSQDLNKAKKATGSVYPEAVVDGSGSVNRIEPILTPQLFLNRFWFGLPIISPVTKEKMTSDMFADLINRAANQIELDAGIEIQTVTRQVRLPFDPNLYSQFVWCEVPHKPIQKVLELSITSASYSYTEQANDKYPVGARIYTIPNEWIDTSYAKHGKLFVNPINPAFSAVGINASAAASGATVLQFIGQQGWVPAYWMIKATFGFCSEDNKVPLIINECIGAKAGMMLIDNVLPLYRVASQSMGIDGLSQSVGDNIQQLLQVKYQNLEKQYMTNMKKIKTLLGNNFIASNV